MNKAPTMQQVMSAAMNAAAEEIQLSCEEKAILADITPEKMKALYESNGCKKVELHQSTNVPARVYLNVNTAVAR